MKLLVNSWYGIHFLCAQDAHKILIIPWVKGHCSHSPSMWNIDLNPLIELPQHKVVWDKFPELPIELWTRRAITDIDNKISRFVFLDVHSLAVVDKRVAWVPVEVDFARGLLPKLELRWQGNHERQCIDYGRIPFKCLSCHKMGHLIRNCASRGKKMSRRIGDKSGLVTIDTDVDASMGTH